MCASLYIICIYVCVCVWRTYIYNETEIVHTQIFRLMAYMLKLHHASVFSYNSVVSTTALKLHCVVKMVLGCHVSANHLSSLSQSDHHNYFVQKNHEKWPPCLTHKLGQKNRGKEPLVESEQNRQNR